MEEQTEEQKQLAQQARDYGKVMQAIAGEIEGAGTMDTDKAEEEPVTGGEVRCQMATSPVVLFTCGHLN